MPAQVLLELSGSWEDDRTADEIIADLKQSRGKHISGSGCFLPATSEKL
jgi:hypothetical protein